MITFGSGGHSTEMSMLFNSVMMRLEKIGHAICVITEDDTVTENKLKESWKKDGQQVKLKTIKHKRSRRVGQSFVSAVPTFIISFIQALFIVLLHRPNILLTNGPAISVVFCLVIRLLQTVTLGNYRCKIIYVESFCRTKTLSLTGRLIYHLRLANKFLVQWPNLLKEYPRATHEGLLV